MLEDVLFSKHLALLGVKDGLERLNLLLNQLFVACLGVIIKLKLLFQLIEVIERLERVGLLAFH